jgi:hypothetical protein
MSGHTASQFLRPLRSGDLSKLHSWIGQRVTATGVVPGFLGLARASPGAAWCTA